MGEAAGHRDGEVLRTIGEVAEDLHVPQHVLRFWETRFPEVRPLKRAGGRRLYRPEDVALLRAVQTLLYADGYTIKGVQRLLAEHGAGHVAEALARSALGPSAGRVHGGAPSPPRVERSPGPGEGARPGAAAAPADTAERLRAVLDDLAECSRLLASVGAPRG